MYCVLFNIFDYILLYWFFLSDSVILGWVGQEVVETPFIELSLIVTPFYFGYFLILIPFLSNFERILIENYYMFNIYSWPNVKNKNNEAAI